MKRKEETSPYVRSEMLSTLQVWLQQRGTAILNIEVMHSDEWFEWAQEIMNKNDESWKVEYDASKMSGFIAPLSGRTGWFQRFFEYI